MVRIVFDKTSVAQMEGLGAFITALRDNGYYYEVKDGTFIVTVLFDPNSK